MAGFDLIVLKVVQQGMSSSSTQFATSRQMGIYEPFRQVGMWKNTFENDNNILYTGTSTIVEVNPRQETKVFI